MMTDKIIQTSCQEFIIYFHTIKVVQIVVSDVI